MAVQGADPLGAVEHVGRDGQHIDPQIPDVQGDDAGGVGGVNVQGHAGLAADGRHVGDGLDGADLVAGMGDGDQGRLPPKGPLDVVGANEPVGVHRQVRDLETLLLQGAAGVHHGRNARSGM